MRISRRDFVKSATASGIALSMTPLAIAEEPNFVARETLPGRQGWNPAATGVGRIDGVAKVTGAKLYASDFRAADLSNWPQATSHAMLIRAKDATHVYDGLDLSRLSGASKPSVVVTAADLTRIGVRVPKFYAGDLLCPVGKTPLYLGQPVALLIFEDFDAFDQARLALRNEPVLKFGKETGPVTLPNYGTFRFTRVGGPTPDAPDVYSPAKNGRVSPGQFEITGRPIWARLTIPTGKAYAEAATFGEEIRAELAGNNPKLLVLDREFETQSVDPMALEPESGLAWYDPRRKNLEIVVSVQSPYEAAGAIAYLLGNARTAFRPAHINTNFAYCGGGFGGRDYTPFPLYIALENNHESPIWHGALNGSGSSTWWRCYPSSACASQTAGLYDCHQRSQRPGALRKRIRFARSEIGQRSRWGVCRGRSRNTGCGKPASRSSCDPSLGKHGGATRLAQFSRISCCTRDWREIC
jgi:Molybdopterin-binding domain of aldehyde dehydrogenase